jgi:regulatory protein
MAKIISIEPHPKVKRRVLVLREGEEAVTVGRKTAREAGWQVDTDVSDAQLQAIILDKEGPSALDRALYYLGAKARSQREVEQFLQSRAYEQPAIDYALAKLMDYGYVDDEALSRELVRRGAEAGRLGRRALSVKLRQRGLDKEQAQAALEEAYSSQEEADNAQELAASLWYKYRNEENPLKRRQKVSQALARKGYGWDSIQSALRHVGEEDEP